jgi:hypothetical protein
MLVDNDTLQWRSVLQWVCQFSYNPPQFWQCAGIYPLPRMREGLHSGLDCVDWEHEGVLKRPCNCSGKHVLQSTPYIRQKAFTVFAWKNSSCS